VAVIAAVGDLIAAVEVVAVAAAGGLIAAVEVVAVAAAAFFSQAAQEPLMLALVMMAVALVTRF